MTTPERKAAFHDWIDRLDDEEYLQELYDTLRLLPKAPPSVGMSRNSWRD